MSWPLILIVGILATFWLRWRHKNKKLLEIAKILPGPRPLPIVGNAIQFMCQPEELIKVLKELIQEYGEVLRFWLGPDLNVVVTNPDDLKILLSSLKTSVKGPQYKYMTDFIGGGILSGSGPTWCKHRKIASPNFGKPVIETYNDIFNQEADLLLIKLRAVPSGRQFDIYKYVVRTTSYAVCQTLMQLSKEQTINLPHLQELIDQTPRLYDIVFERMTKWYLQIDPVFWMTGLYQEQKQFIKIMREFCEAIINHRKDKLKILEQESKTHSMNEEDGTQWGVIDRFILSQELNFDELWQETFTVFTSGQEATAKITSFLLLMMAYHPKCQERLYAEIKSVVGDEDRWVAGEDLKEMPYLDMVFKEVVRLFPSGAMLQRTISEDITISSGTLPAGCSLLAPIYHLHRDPRFWTSPEDFDPERFNAVNTKLRHPNCYVPFSTGPMDCLGRYYGAKIVKTICVRVLRDFELTSLNAYEDLKMSIAISATSLDGYRVILNPRIRNTRL